IAEALANAGADLVLVGRDAAALKQAQNELTLFNHRVDVIAADMGLPHDAERMCQAALAQHGPIDILINNVGGRRVDVATENMLVDEWLKFMDLNVTSAFIT